jgi:hypothetical protein
MKCAKSVAGRWFDKRQLRVEFVDSIPNSAWKIGILRVISKRQTAASLLPLSLLSYFV